MTRATLILTLSYNEMQAALSMGNTTDITQKKQKFCSQQFCQSFFFQFLHKVKWHGRLRLSGKQILQLLTQPISVFQGPFIYSLCYITEGQAKNVAREFHFRDALVVGICLFLYFFPGVGEMNLVIQSDPCSLNSVPPTSLLGSKTIWSSDCSLSMVSDS